MTVLTSNVMAVPAAQAATFDLDFDWSGLVVDGDTSNAGKALNAYKIDGGGKGYQWANGAKRSTTRDNIGAIWEDFGITITGLNNSQTAANSTPLGLFNSNCAPKDGTSESGFTFACAKSKTLGDNDLATGKGSYGNINYDTQAQGNLLIFEENAGDGVADDTSKGGTFLFDIADGKNWTVENIGVVDDAKGKITYTYRDGSKSSENINIQGENEVQYFTAAQKKEIARIAVQFNNSGGISGLRFREIEEAPAHVPEPTAVLGLVAFGAVSRRLKRQKQENAHA
ncbi:MAG: hypothetical protein ACFBSF_05690 [Leptolyngbyaceae cyanobacterium]